MIKHIKISILLFLISCISAAAQENKPSLEYDVDFETLFDNREYYKSNFSNSMTIFGTRLSPSVGFSVPQNSLGLSHKIMIGIDIRKDFGASPLDTSLDAADPAEADPRLNNWKLFDEISLYYNLRKKFERSELEVYAGVFPRKIMEGDYSEAFFSDSLKFYDNNLEGLILKLRRPKSYWELGCDWIGQRGVARKEKFMIFSAGEAQLNSFLNLGYAAYMYHFAGSHKAEGVVDNILINPYLKFDFAQDLNFQDFSLRLGWLQSLQHDRVFVGHYVFPSGGEAEFNVKKWNFGLSNRLFYGRNMMPYYNDNDAAGDKYGSRLYFGDPFYRVHDSSANRGPGLYDCLELFYEPFKTKYLAIKISARFHFNDTKYSGCQQIVGIKFNLNELLKQ